MNIVLGFVGIGIGLFIVIMIGAVPLLLYMNDLQRKRYASIYRAIISVAFINIIAQMTLQLFGIYNFLDMDNLTAVNDLYGHKTVSRPNHEFKWTVVRIQPDGGFLYGGGETETLRDVMNRFYMRKNYADQG